MSGIEFVAQGLNGIGTLSNIIGINIKNKDKCLILFTIGNLLISISLGLLGGFSGMFVQLVFVTESIINYFLEKKENFRYPVWLILLYILLPVAIITFSIKSFWDFLPMIAGILFPMAIISKGFKLRLLNLFSVLIWIPYNFFFHQYIGVISCTIFSFINLLAIIRIDVRKK